MTPTQQLFLKYGKTCYSYLMKSPATEFSCIGSSIASTISAPIIRRGATLSRRSVCIAAKGAPGESWSWKIGGKNCIVAARWSRPRVDPLGSFALSLVVPDYEIMRSPRAVVWKYLLATEWGAILLVQPLPRRLRRRRRYMLNIIVGRVCSAARAPQRKEKDCFILEGPVMYALLISIPLSSAISLSG